MKAGFIIEDNTIKVSFLNEMGQPIHLMFDHESYLKGELIIQDNHVYTEGLIPFVKLASPSLRLIENLFVPEEDPEAINESLWSKTQLCAILFKKVLFKLNSRIIDTVDEIHFGCPEHWSENQKEVLTKSIRANGISKINERSYLEIIKGYLTKFFSKLSSSLILNISHNSYTIYPGFEKVDWVLPYIWVQEDVYDFIRHHHIKLEAIHPVDFKLIKAEIGKLYLDLLNSKPKDDYTLIIQEECLKYKPSAEAFRQKVSSQLDSVVKELKSEDSVFVTGRLAQFSLINGLLEKDLLPGVNLVFDENNESKSKGILINTPTCSGQDSEEEDQDNAFLEGLIIDNEIY